MEIDWHQAQLNGWSYCFSIQNDGLFCGRAEHWVGHEEGIEHGHLFESFAQFLDNKRADNRWIDSQLVAKCKRLEEQNATLTARVEELEGQNAWAGDVLAQSRKRADELTEDLEALKRSHVVVCEHNATLEREKGKFLKLIESVGNLVDKSALVDKDEMSRRLIEYLDAARSADAEKGE